MSTPLTAAQAAAELGLSVTRVRELAQRGQLPGTKFGRDWLFAAKDVTAFKKLDRPPGRPKAQ